MLTIKELVQAVGRGTTPRMVRHYHKIGLLPEPTRSQGNYRLYTPADVQQLQRIVALKQQGFQLTHIQQVLATETADAPGEALELRLQEQYQRVLQQLVKLRQTATALEGLLGRDRPCQSTGAVVLAQLRRLAVETEAAQTLSTELWEHLDAAVPNHPENFQEALQRLLPPASGRSEIELDLWAHLVLACGDASLPAFVRLSPGAIAAARTALAAGCQVVGDIPAVVAALDQPRLAHLGCTWTALLEDPHITSAPEAEQRFWADPAGQARLRSLLGGNIWVIGYAPSVLLSLCEAIASGATPPALVIGLPLGFSHAPAAKRRLQHLPVPSLTIDSTLGGGLLAAIACNRLAASLIEKPDCHCHLSA